MPKQPGRIEGTMPLHGIPNNEETEVVVEIHPPEPPLGWLAVVFLKETLKRDITVGEVEGYQQDVEVIGALVKHYGFKSRKA